MRGEYSQGSRTASLFYSVGCKVEVPRLQCGEGINIVCPTEYEYGMVLVNLSKGQQVLVNKVGMVQNLEKSAIGAGNGK